MRYLTDSEVLKWGEELKINIVPRYSPYGGIDIAINEKSPYKKPWQINDNLSSDKLINNIKYKFTFSISENRVGDFERFLEKNKEFNTKIVVDDIENKNHSMLNAPVKYIDIKYLDELNNFTTEKHTLYNRSYVRYKYEFDCHFASIIAVVTLLKDAIDYIAMIWGYDDKGNEINLLKYNIGDIVSPVKDKSKDYLILDHVVKSFNNKKELLYILTEIKSDEKSPVIRYGEVLELFEDSISFSRNDRINNILN